jgi:hypothetical protein
MPTLVTDAGEDIRVSMRLIAKLADRIWRMPPDRRANYLAGARRRLDTGHPSRNDAAAILAVGG